MKTAVRSVLLLGLLLVAFLLVGVWQKPTPMVEMPTTSSQPSNVRPNTPFATPAPVESVSEAVEHSLPVMSGNWDQDRRTLKALAAKDPDAALAQVAKMPDKHEQKAAAKEICLIVAEKNPAKAMTAAWKLELGRFSNEMAESMALENLAKKWADADLVKAFAWASALPPDDEGRRDRVVKGIASTVAAVDPAVAARMVAQQINPDSGVQIDAVMDVLRHWAARDYKGATAWAAGFPEGPIRDRGFEELASVGASPPLTEPKSN